MATGRWVEEGVPHRGWRCVGIRDNGGGDAMQTCEMCQVMRIRYVHTMEHPEFPESLECGCICAGHMEQNYAAAHDREARLRRQSSERSRWLTRKWKAGRRKGYPYLKLRDGYHVIVFPLQGKDGWGSRITRTETRQHWYSRRFYATEEAAKIGAFTGLAFLRARAQ